MWVDSALPDAAPGHTVPLAEARRTASEPVWLRALRRENRGTRRESRYRGSASAVPAFLRTPPVEPRKRACDTH